MRSVEGCYTLSGAHGAGVVGEGPCKNGGLKVNGNSKRTHT